MQSSSRTAACRLQIHWNWLRNLAEGTRQVNIGADDVGRGRSPTTSAMRFEFPDYYLRIPESPSTVTTGYNR